MTDLPEDSWTPHEIGCNCEICQNDLPCSRGELAAESSAITTSMMRHMAKMAETMRDHMYHLHKTHTVSLMAAELYGKCTEAEPEFVAKMLYQNVEKNLEIGNVITGSIPPAA